MRYSEHNHFIFDVQMHKERLTGVGGWSKRWQRWVGRRSIGSSSVDKSVDLPFLQCVDERGYEMRMSNLLDAYCAAGVDVSNLLLGLVCFDGPFWTSFRSVLLDFGQCTCCLRSGCVLRCDPQSLLVGKMSKFTVFRNVDSGVLIFLSRRGGMVGNLVAYCAS